MFPAGVELGVTQHNWQLKHEHLARTPRLAHHTEFENISPNAHLMIEGSSVLLNPRR